MKSKRTNPDYLNGVPELLILQLLERRPMHGYDIVQSLQGVAEGVLGFGEGCIYPILHRLEQEKLLKGVQQVVAGRKRVVYHVTATGKKRLHERVATWKRITQAISLALHGEQDAITKLA